MDYLNKLFSVGDKVKVIANECSHEFEIGTTAYIEAVNAVNYTVRGEEDYWYMVDSELELYEEQLK